MKGFLDGRAVANLTGFSVDEIKHFIETKQIPHIHFPKDESYLFPVADIEGWMRTHKPAKPKAAAGEWKEPEEKSSQDIPAPPEPKPKPAPKKRQPAEKKAPRRGKK